ncbi:hypothetical protein XNC1_0215 [Xenorhabdus nematophila ATCC 19061]|uniref:Uncharacterized protein n=1 Tax=Xenorhabdus nematophila (strain ATCC 19061 / DSM 3370 / CCUG 14189 / LMG 1036 / NCIMB 9965 / AN6) TaxID=406817 RepID=D3VH18_XENNA|nr:hypothetical protein XNC1_0215 [Xenorhabdus nematophila ATCC 19061]CEK21220.1 hypothetical protein XNC2_0216 [Xenorhabdus nematophila AN6/1]
MYREKGTCEFIVNVRKREIAKLKSACCVNKMSEFAFIYDFISLGIVISHTFWFSHYISRYTTH